MLLSMSISAAAAISGNGNHEEEKTRTPSRHKQQQQGKNNNNFVKEETSEQPFKHSYLYTTIVQRWPALSICLSVTTILFLVLFRFAIAGWPGTEITSNCYEDYLVTPDCFCEKLRGEKPSDVWIAQPMNTLTNLWFVLVGLLIAYSADTRTLPSKEWWDDDINTNTDIDTRKKEQQGKNLITRDKIYSIVLALDACLLGVGSTFLHASFTNRGREADMTAMYLIATYMIVYPLLRERQITKEQAMWVYGLGNISLFYWVINISTPEQARKLFTTLMLISWTIEIFWVDREWAKKNQNARRIFFTNLFMFIVAVLQWKASESGGPLCAPESIFQGHSLWHFQSAVGIGGVYLYYLAEEEEVPACTSSSSSSQKTKAAVYANSSFASSTSASNSGRSFSTHSTSSTEQSLAEGGEEEESSEEDASSWCDEDSGSETASCDGNK